MEEKKGLVLSKFYSELSLKKGLHIEEYLIKDDLMKIYR